MSDPFIFQKSVDKSVLFEGLSIPVVFQRKLIDKLGVSLLKGEKRRIKILFDNIEYEAELKNQPFDEKAFPGHVDVLQIRYNRNSPIAIAIRNKFAHTKEIVENQLLQRENSKKRIIIPQQDCEYIAFYGTPVAGTLMMDCITNSEYKTGTQEIVKENENVFEEIINQKDENAKIVLSSSERKIRRLSKAIGDSLKELYQFRCQICGKVIGEEYGSHLIQAHHIDYFTKSLNNDATNIMIVCPNHHCVIHDRNPEFDWKNKLYVYPNGYREGLKINYHI